MTARLRSCVVDGRAGCVLDSTPVGVYTDTGEAAYVHTVLMLGPAHGRHAVRDPELVTTTGPTGPPTSRHNEARQLCGWLSVQRTRSLPTHERRMVEVLILLVGGAGRSTMIRRSEPLMSHHASAHPLDSDLLDFVEGTLPATESRSIDEHLAGCILCRIKRQRLTNVPPLDLIGVEDLALPTFTPIRSEPLDGSEAIRGDLWTTASDDSAVVLIRSVRENDWGVVVVPVILDVEVADSGALVLDETASPLDMPIAIYERMMISLPLSALAARLVPVRAGIDLWSLAVGDPGVTRGSGLQGATDPRIELRQYLADRLVALDPHEATYEAAP